MIVKIKGVGLHNAPARVIATYVHAGVEVWATDAQWRRIERHVRTTPMTIEQMVVYAHDMYIEATVEALIMGIDISTL